MPRRVSLVLALVLAILLAPGWTLAQDDPSQASTKTVNVELILDASGSMAELLPEGEPRMTAAKRILRQVIADLPEREGVNVGLRVYGHKGDNTQAGKAESCRSSELLVPISGIYKEQLTAQVEAIQPTGWTPITYSLQQAAADFQPGESITNAIVLVTDGEETCDPPEQSCQASAALHQANVQVTTHVVGFALTAEQTELVRCVAEEGGGQLFGADNAQELGQALTTALEEVGVGDSLRPQPEVLTPTALADIRTLAYHQLTTWTEGVDTGGERAPILSDDGQTIAVTRDPGVPNDPTNPNRIFVLDADGTGERQVDEYAPLCGCRSLIDISADGSRVVSSDEVQLRVAETSGGGGRTLLTSGEINAVRLSGDGRTIVFRLYRDAGQLERGIWVINADGTGQRQLVGPSQIAPLLGVTPAELPFFAAGFGVDVSANGGQIIFGMDLEPFGGEEGQGLFAVNGDGSGLRNLLGRVSYVNNGAISGDGATVAYVTGGLGPQEAGVIGFDGSGQRLLTDNPGRPGTGVGGSSMLGERIQLSFDGSRLLLGSSGVLYDTASGARLALGLETPTPPEQRALVTEGLLRATMDAAALRVVYLYQPVSGPLQLARLDLNPTDLLGAPSMTEARVDPTFVLTEGRSAATESARVNPLEPVPWVGGRVLRDGLPDDTFPRVALFDDGATGGDAAATDGIFTNSINSCCAEIGPRTVRIQAEQVAADGVQHATVVDVSPFAVVTDPSEAPQPATSTPVTPVPAEGSEAPTVEGPAAEGPPTTEPPTPDSLTPGPPPPPTGIPGPDVPEPGTPPAGLPPTSAPAVTAAPPESTPPMDPAQATIAAQATLIAELQGPTATPPTPVTEMPALPETEEPRLTLQGEPTQLAVGEEVRVSAQSSGVGIPIFAVWLRDVGTESFTEIVRIDYEGRVQRRADGTRVLELVEASGGASGFEGTVEVTFRAIAPGEAEVMVDASGEVVTSSGYSWGGAGSDPLLITVVASDAATPSTTAADVGEGTQPLADFITPDPAECTVAPRTAEELTALAASPDPEAAAALDTASTTPGLELPAGQPANAATVASVGDTFRQFTACLNAGQTLAAYTLWTDDALRQSVVQAPSAAPTPVPEEQQTAFRLGPVQSLADGRVAAVLEQRFPLFTGATVYILVELDGRYLIDETLDMDLTSAA